MGLFKKKRVEQNYSGEPTGLPELPRIPDYPNINELPSLGEGRDYMSRENNFGNKFSQSAIKNAVTGTPGEKEVGDFDADDSNINWMMPRSPKSFTKEVDFPKRTNSEMEVPQSFSKSKRGEQPVFIRLDKFEESLHTFKKAKSQVVEIEKMLREIKRMKEDEEKELQYWESQIQSIKEQIEKVDKEIFSKVE